MNQAENYAILFDDNEEQARDLAENMSIWKTDDWKNGTTVFGFEDGSAIYTSGREFRQATAQEIAEAGV